MPPLRARRRQLARLSKISAFLPVAGTSGVSCFRVVRAGEIFGPATPQETIDPIMPKSFTYKNYCVTVETDIAALPPGPGTDVSGAFSIWQWTDGAVGRQVYCGRTSKTFSLADSAARDAAAEAEARAWIDRNAGKPWA